MVEEVKGTISIKSKDVFFDLISTMQSLKSQMTDVSEGVMVARAHKQVEAVNKIETDIMEECLKI